LLVVLLACATCERAAPWPAATAQVATAIRFVSPLETPDGAADGSSSHPFAGLAQALSQAPAGALLRLSEGTYAGPFVLKNPVVVLGAGKNKTRLVLAADAWGPVIATDGNALELRDVAVVGGQSGISAARTSLRLVNVSIRNQSDSALTASGTDVDLAGGEVLSVAAGRSGKGLLIEGGTLHVQGTVFREAGRRAILLHRAKALLVGLDIEGSAVSAVQALDDSDVVVEGGSFHRMGGPALYASGSALTVRKVRVGRAEYGVLVFRKSRLEVRDAYIADTGVAGVGLVLSGGVISGTTIVHGGTEGAVSVTGSPEALRLEGNRIGEPGSMGVHATNSTIIATDNVFSGAVLDAQGDLGDAFYAVESDLTLLRNRFDRNAGSGVTLVRSRAHLVGNRFTSNERGGLFLLDRSSAKAQANEFSSNAGPGISAAERSHALVARNRFADSGPVEMDTPCGGGGEIDVRNNDFLGSGAVRSRCP
jgi:hypothetical protein